MPYLRPCRRSCSVSPELATAAVSSNCLSRNGDAC
jgi:hypothetical protein